VALTDVPVSIAMRHKLLYNRPAPPEELSRIGDLYKEKGLLHDALEFYRVAKDKSKLDLLVAEAAREADLVLYLNACKGLGREPAREELEAVKASALRLGKESVARTVELLSLSKDKK